MGAGAQQASSEETTLSTTQAEILKQRQQDYMDYFLPELKSQISEAKGGTETTALYQKQAQAINQQAKASQRQLSQSLAQRGLSGSGTDLAATANLQNAKRQSLADAYYSSTLQNQATQQKLLGMGLGMSPTPTTAAPMGQSSSGWNFNL